MRISTKVVKEQAGTIGVGLVLAGFVGVLFKDADTHAGLSSIAVGLIALIYSAVENHSEEDK